jgi:hypothetical protein
MSVTDLVFASITARTPTQKRLARIDLHSFPIHCRLETSLVPNGDEISLVMLTPDRDNQKATVQLRFTVVIDASALDDDAFFTRIRSFVTEAVLHELDEHLIVDGERRWNPHRNDRFEIVVRP